MEIPDIFGTIAEIIITMAGFMGVVVAFSQSQSKPQEMYFRIQWTFAVTLVALVALLAPHLLIGFSGSQTIVYGLPLAFFGLSSFFILGFGLWQQISGKTTRTAPTFVQRSLITISVFVAVSLLLSAANVLIPRIPEMLIFGSMWSIFMITTAFVSSIWQGMNT